ncbi:hypothetical protein ACE2AJ_00410 [Aquihabitans daechungensis]|uniref:hypothetical protein n=1 Tax=Aquihabitans daechungensis TaxID=1052257 RepID=UPI003B9FCCBA
MGAREDVVAAAERLTSRGESPFGPLDVLAEVKRVGCAYPDQTIRTQLVAHLSVVDPDEPITVRKPLRRVARGRYVLGPVTAPVKPEPPQRPSASALSDDPMTEWHWEGNVQSAVVGHLVAEGWSIVRVADTSTKEHGHDVVAERGSERVIVEVKGYPSHLYVRGDRAGQKKPTSPNTQARHWFAMAVLAGATMRSSEEGSRVVLALPDYTTYRNLAERTRPALRAMSVEVWLVDESNRVNPVS